MDSLMIPSAIQRIRSFLIEMAGMKVKPWATTEETLAALHRTLVARHSCQMFWASLRVLLENLAKDLKARQEAPAGTLLDNELLAGQRYAALLDEIQAALAAQAAQPSTFRRLAGALSPAALGLLLLLGGAVTVACDRSALHTRSPTGAGQSPDTAGPAPDARTQGPDTAAPGAGDALASRDASVSIALPDVPPARKDFGPDTFAPTPLDGAVVSIEDVMAACNLDPTAVLDCLSIMRTSWTTGMGQALAGQRCDFVQRDLTCFLQNSCAPSPKDFDPNTAFYCPPIIIYMGVRFV